MLRVECHALKSTKKFVETSREQYGSQVVLQELCDL